MGPTFVEDLNGQTSPLQIENTSQPRAAAHPIHTLPSEILVEIFVHFLPAYPEFPPLSGLLSPLLLCRICQEWRAIALSTPSLWSAIRITSPRDGDALESHEVSKLEILKTWLTRSRNCPLSLSLSGASHSLLLSDFLDAIASHCRRWEHLDALVHMEDINLMQSEMPLLRHLRFGPNAFCPRVSEPPTLFARAPLLRTVVLTDNFLIGRMRLPWAQLTHLYAECLYESECLEMVREATHLVSFTAGIVPLKYPDPEENSAGAGFTVPVHRHLRDLILHSLRPQYEWKWKILDRLTLPALCRLQIPEARTTLESLKGFVSRSQCTLEELCVTHATLPESAFRHISINQGDQE
ncbi:hypothetical protein C8F04DRAFT_1075092 [Mycena alexandri]|uniref:F-box domain-containing protein n=1 Tax=Mycena alexandri TaxID=1745969 RepID=A0AAD6XAN2_9AGAR|nr:hypothetical protein C8F04DRAFT_1075092 [Mycena alexandri]